LGNNSYLASFELFFVLCQQKWTAVEKEDMRAKSEEGLDIELVKVEEMKKRFLEGWMESLKGTGSFRAGEASLI